MNKKPSCAFIDLEMACDRIPKEVVCWCLRKNVVPEEIVLIVMKMYAGANTIVRTMNGDSQYFRVDVGPHQDSAASHFLFVTVMDVLSDIREICGSSRSSMTWS